MQGLVFRGSALRKLHDKLITMKWGHLDLQICRALPETGFYLPKKSLFGSRKHLSVPAGGFFGEPKKRPAAPPGVDTRKRRRR